MDQRTPVLLTQGFSLLVLGLGVYLMVVAVKNRDYPYNTALWFQSGKPIGITSRDWGRKTARIYGFLTGGLLKYLLIKEQKGKE